MEHRGVIQPLPSLTEPEQRAALKPFDCTELYILGRDATHEDLLRQQRKGRVIVVQWTGLLARQRGTKDSRIISLLEFVDELRAKGGFIIEAATGKRSDRPADWRAMRAKAEEMLGRIAQGAKSAENARRGRVGFGHSDQDLQHMLRVMDSRRYQNDKQRINAIRKLGVEPVPRRTWLNTRLKLIARERGLLD